MSLEDAVLLRAAFDKLRDMTRTSSVIVTVGHTPFGLRAGTSDGELELFIDNHKGSMIYWAKKGCP